MTRPGQHRVRVLVVTSGQPLDDAALSPRERYACPSGSARRRERLASRRALRLLLGVLGLPPDTTGYAFPHPRLSLAHTDGRGVAAGAIDPSAGIGVDLEQLRPTDPRTARFFLHHDEEAWLNRTCPREVDHLRLWTVKEALFKADLGNRTTTLGDYALDDPAARTGLARGPDGVRFVYTSTRRRDAVLSVAAAVRPRPSGADMSMPEITFEAVAARLDSLLPVPAGSLTPQTSLVDLAGDSFELVEIVIDLQEEFGASFTQAELRAALTLGDLVALLRGESHVAQN